MRIAIISDIHGNCVALDTVLDDLSQESVDQIVCLGDAVQGGAQPVETVARLRELACPIVMGNADDWLLTGKADDDEDIPEARRKKLDTVREWQLSLLKPEDLAFIGSFQPTIEIDPGNGRTLLCYHGSPRSFYDIILPETPTEEVQKFLAPQENIIYTGGHTHTQFIKHLGRTFHFNPGSVGVAYRHGQPDDNFRFDPWAEYALLTVKNERLALEFRRVPLNLAHFIHVERTSGIPFAEETIARYSS